MKVQPGDLEKSKREAIENQLNMLRRIYVQVGSKSIIPLLRENTIWFNLK